MGSSGSTTIGPVFVTGCVDSGPSFSFSLTSGSGGLGGSTFAILPVSSPACSIVLVVGHDREDRLLGLFRPFGQCLCQQGGSAVADTGGKKQYFLHVHVSV